MHKSLLPGVDWVGAIDWNVRDFHSYNTDHGATYNAYLVQSGENALIDAVKAPFFERYHRQVTQLVPPQSIKYIVVNHAELDHSSSLPAAVRAFPNATLVATKKTRDICEKYFAGAGAGEWPWRAVKTGDAISLGGRTLTFVETPMAHWPDSMVTYLPEDEILFSMDAFGQHFASAARYDDEADFDVIMEEAKTYYANIVVPHGKFVQKALDAARGLKIKMIAPSHGVIWRSRVADILAAYTDWAANKVSPKVAVFYDSMWESTGALAEAIAAGADAAGARTVMLHVRHNSLTRIATEFMDTAAFAFGSATLNNLLMPAAAAALVYMRGMNQPAKPCFAFGSHGWAGKGGADQVEEEMRRAGWTIARPPLKCAYRPGADVLAEAEAAGRDLAAAAIAAARG